MKKYIVCCAASLLLITSCSKSPQKAREELTKIGIEFTDEGFNTAIKKKDKIAIDLFLDAEHDASYVLADAIKIYAKEENEDISLVKELIDNSSNFNVRHKSLFGYDSALGEAVNRENIEIIKLLLKKGADPDFNDGEALKNALLNKKNLKITKMLLDAGADINIKDRDESSLLYNALIDKHLPTSEKDEEIDVVQFLLDRGVDVNDGEDGNSDSLVYAVYDENLELIETLLKKGANINSTWQDPNSMVTFFGGTPRKYTLYEMAEGNSEVIAILEKYSKQQNQAKK